MISNGSVKEKSPGLTEAGVGFLHDRAVRNKNHGILRVAQPWSGIVDQLDIHNAAKLRAIYGLDSDAKEKKEATKWLEEHHGKIELHFQ